MSVANRLKCALSHTPGSGGRGLPVDGEIQFKLSKKPLGGRAKVARIYEAARGVSIFLGRRPRAPADGSGLMDEHGRVKGLKEKAAMFYHSGSSGDPDRAPPPLPPDPDLLHFHTGSPTFLNMLIFPGRSPLSSPGDDISGVTAAYPRRGPGDSDVLVPVSLGI